MSYHGGLAIWGGSRVELTETHITPDGLYLHAGSQGVNRGQRRDGETLVALDLGREAHIPLNKLKRINKEEYVPDAITWTPFPEGRLSHPHHADLVKYESIKGDYRYQMRGWSGKWYVRQEPIDGEGEIKRSKFFPNQRLALDHYNHVVYGA
ncbi:hypothetical protein ACFVH6_25640 [Spirillospora sp. NPDC127200]